MIGSRFMHKEAFTYPSYSHLLATLMAAALLLSSSPFSPASASRHFADNLMLRVPKSSTIGDVIGCKAVPSIKVFKFLNRICEDCFQLYRDAELYHMCRQVKSLSWDRSLFLLQFKTK